MNSRSEWNNAIEADSQILQWSTGWAGAGTPQKGLCRWGMCEVLVLLNFRNLCEHQLEKLAGWIYVTVSSVVWWKIQKDVRIMVCSWQLYLGRCYHNVQGKCVDCRVRPKEVDQQTSEKLPHDGQGHVTSAPTCLQLHGLSQIDLVLFFRYSNLGPIQGHWTNMFSSLQ